jgi:hypothetical protein
VGSNALGRDRRGCFFENEAIVFWFVIRFGVIDAAFELDLFEKRHGFFELAMEALGVEAEARQGLGLRFEGRGDGEGLLDLFRSVGELGRDVDDAQGEEIVFECGDAVDAPGGVGEGLDEMGFDGAAGVVFVAEGVAVGAVGVEVFAGEDDDLAGESVPEGVERRALLSGGGFGASGVAGVLAVGFGSLRGCHIDFEIAWGGVAEGRTESGCH